MVRFTLLENALDSVETGLDYFNKARETQARRDYKQCLLNIFQAAELLLKAVVSRQGAERIFTPKSLRSNCKDPTLPTESELHRCQSVNIKQSKLIRGDFCGSGLGNVPETARTAQNRAEVVSAVRVMTRYGKSEGRQ